MSISMSEYGDIRRERFVDQNAIKEIARNHSMSKNTVKKYVNGDREPGNIGHENHSCPVMTEAVKKFIDDKIKEVEKEGNGSKKHHLTAKRAYDLLVEADKDKNNPIVFKGGESTVRKYMAEKKPFIPSKSFVPLGYRPAEIMQIDFGSTKAYLGGSAVLEDLSFFCARLGYSTAPFIKVYRKQTTECLLDGLNEAFKYFGGVPKKVVFDNGAAAVKEGHGKNAKPVDRYVAMAAYYAFEMVFCNPASGNEKGLVEGLVNNAKCNYMTPYPHAENIDDLNAKLNAACIEKRNSQAHNRGATVGVLLAEEQQFLTQFPHYEFDVATREELKVCPSSYVTFETNAYSVPCKYTNKKVTVCAYPEKIKILCTGKVIAEHERLMGRYGHKFVFEHYAELLATKPRAILNSRVVMDNFPDYFIDWVYTLDAKPREIIDTMSRALEIGFDVVMKGEIVFSKQTESKNEEHPDVNVEVADPEEYDKIFGLGEDNDEGSVGCANRNMREKS